MHERLTTTQFLVLERLLERRSVSGVAADLNLSQPTVSLHLRSLRRKLGDPLFVRAGNGLAPTPRAEALRERVSAALAAIDAVSATSGAFAPAGLRQTFRIAMTDASQVTLLPRLLTRLKAEAPQAGLEVSLIGPGTRGALRDGRIDLALGYIPELGAAMMTQRLFFQDWVCLTAPRETMSIADYRTADHVAVASGTGSGLLNRALDAAGIARRVTLTLPGFLGLAAVLSHSTLVATLPRHSASVLAAQGDLVIHPCPFAVEPFAVAQYWHERLSADPAHIWLRDSCRDTFSFDGIVSARPRENSLQSVDR